MSALHTALTAAFVLLAADAADAHTVIQGASGFPGGFLHPLLVPAHVLALCALGLMAGQQSRGHRFVILILFVCGLFAAVAVVTLAASTDHGELAVLVMAAACALLAAAGRTLPLPVTGALAAACGVSILLDSVPALTSVADTLVALAGTALAAPIVPGAVAAIAAAANRDWHRIAVRIAGSWAAATALLVLALRLAR